MLLAMMIFLTVPICVHSYTPTHQGKEDDIKIELENYFIESNPFEWMVRLRIVMILHSTHSLTQILSLSLNSFSNVLQQWEREREYRDARRL